MLHEPRSSIPPSWVGVGKHAPCRPLPPVLILVQTGVMQHFVISPRLSLRTPRSFNIKFGGNGGDKDCTSGPKTDKIDATFRPPTVAPNALLHFCEVGDKGRDDRIARIGRKKGRGEGTTKGKHRYNEEASVWIARIGRGEGNMTTLRKNRDD